MAFDASILKPRVNEATAVPTTYAATVTLDATKGHRFTITATGAMTLDAITGGYDGQVVLVEVTASGGARAVTMTVAANKFVATDANSLGSATTVASGKVGYFSFRYNAALARWVPTSIFQTA